MKKLLLFFIDGLGLHHESNPVSDLFYQITGIPLTYRTDSHFFDNGVLIPIDAVMGVPGIPQSATGQTSIFTGINAQKELGIHLSAFPNKALMALIEKYSMMKVLKEHRINVTSANLYSQAFFKKRENTRKNRYPVSTLTIKASGTPFRYIEDYQNGKAVFADITNGLLRQMGYPIPLISPETAGENMMNIINSHDFVFFEYFLTDTYGHKKDETRIQECLDHIDRFTNHIWNSIDDQTSILIISDHGNCEDLSTGDHTKNPVPCLLFTRQKKEALHFEKGLKTLADVYHKTVSYFTSD